jgi:hypothetical protein
MKFDEINQSRPLDTKNSTLLRVKSSNFHPVGAKTPLARKLLSQNLNLLRDVRVAQRVILSRHFSFHF